ncbi:hypothetical protein FV139_05810 [Parahaliea maris]|uniref:Uncharacterized protein n=1 Tax=Parahaliea maris TaxID=2716870 RepID=A0A5C9A856_9GAMM|nr:hypothetical protein [Parahaliea maris]TXS95401.1 hypothetical protein FV139_05810 [Parahaliea maris]
MNRSISQLLTCLALCLGTTVAVAQDNTVSADDIRARWEHANFELSGDAREHALEEVAAACEQATGTHREDAALLTWCGITHSSYAGAKGGLGALGEAKRARALLEQAVEADRSVLNGAALCSLGTLYAKVPGWPLGFGDDERAEKYLQEALTVAPDDIDNNYFMADFLYGEHRREEALKYLQHAQQASPRPGREVADRGRQVEISQLATQLAK